MSLLFRERRKEAKKERKRREEKRKTSQACSMLNYSDALLDPYENPDVPAQAGCHLCNGKTVMSPNPFRPTYLI